MHQQGLTKCYLPVAEQADNDDKALETCFTLA